MAKQHLFYIGNGRFKMDGITYDTSKTEKEALLKDWTCPHCKQTELSYRDEVTSEEHFKICKVLKKKRKIATKKRLTSKQSNTLETLGIIKK